MNREIKFRGISYIDNMWVYGHLSLKESMYHIKNTHPVKESTIGQYTGLKDKNGVEIYEGDVLFYAASNHSSMVVKFENGCFVGEGQFNTFPLIDYITATDFEFIEVMGNIYESHELLK